MKIELEHVLPADIERRSFAIISQELGPRTYGGPYEELILKRVIHTSADFDYSENLTFSPGARAWELYAACLADINAGRLGAEDVSGVGTKDDADYTPLYLMFIVTTNTPGETVNLYVDSIPLGADETVRVLEQAGAEIYWKTS